MTLQSSLSSNPNEFWFVLIYFLIYLGTVSNSVAMLTIGGIKRKDRLILFGPLFYIPVVWSQSQSRGANIEMLLNLVCIFTVPAALLGLFLGLWIRKITKGNPDHTEADSD